MKEVKATASQQDWEYRQALQEHRKAQRNKRAARRGRKGQWEPLPADREAA
jgi:hypothetical protein